jgi:hypothetical protein
MHIVVCILYVLLWVGCEKGNFLLSSILSLGFSHLCQKKVLFFWLGFGVYGLFVMVTLSLTLLEIWWQENGVTTKGLTKLTKIKLQRETIMLYPNFSMLHMMVRTWNLDMFAY